MRLRKQNPRFQERWGFCLW